MKSVYLGGPIKGLSYGGCNDWREYAKSWLNEREIVGISPMRAKENLANEREIKDHYNDALNCPKGLVTRDRFDVNSCDIVLFNLLGANKISIGTLIEYGWADSARKPIITAIEREGNPHEHSFVRELSGFCVETLEEGLYIAKAVLTY